MEGAAEEELVSCAIAGVDKPMTSTNTQHAFVVSMATVIDEIATDIVVPTFDLKMIQHHPRLDRAPDDPRDHPIKPDFANFPTPPAARLQLPPAGPRCG
jgi:hypothetical protein